MKIRDEANRNKPSRKTRKILFKIKIWKGNTSTKAENTSTKDPGKHKGKQRKKNKENKTKHETRENTTPSNPNLNQERDRLDADLASQLCKKVYATETAIDVHKEIQALASNSLLSTKKETLIGTWNVRTLYQCGKLAQTINEFDNYRLDILGLSEIRWTGSGKTCSEGKNYIILGSQRQTHTWSRNNTKQESNTKSDWMETCER